MSRSKYVWQFESNNICSYFGAITQITSRNMYRFLPTCIILFNVISNSIIKSGTDNAHDLVLLYYSVVGGGLCLPYWETDVEVRIKQMGMVIVI